MRFTLQVVILVISGVVGGSFSNWFMQSQAMARDQIDIKSDSVTARIFRLVDYNGNLRGVFGFEESESPSLIFYDKAKKVKAFITAQASGSLMVFNDNQSRMRMGLRLDDSGELSLTYFDEGNIHRASLIVNPSDGPKIGFMDNRGVLRLGLQLHRGKEPMIMTMNESGKQNSIIFNHGNFGPGLFIHDSSGQPQMAYTGRGPVDATRVGQGKN